MKGADQCPRCASRKWGDVEQAVTGFYAVSLRVCGNCATAWEPIDPAAIFDADDPLASFSEPCGNCAFRPGSPEQANTAEWKKTIAALKAGGNFYCHKGVPVTPGSEHGFDYPEGGKNPRKLRLCRGFLNTLNKRFGRFEVADTPCPPTEDAEPWIDLVSMTESVA
ncbi:hypothetical protein QH494_16120 [Sphingomonas sp. AR_OL41]|uniref:hypothetical protein n=1 Tax=Sphingomonas sp. AR_OL41 TaxID=3042729 RepID=UPI00248146D8|nr:hypothetical protein [Sphingomonas sp. AR_OL41]MDH7973719.1 hypothetical protein [Sphingomonas sp. AR_OL41]